MIIACFANVRWSGLWQRYQQIMSRLARHGHFIFYVEPPSFLDSTEPRSQRSASPPPNVTIVSPNLIPAYTLRPLEFLDGLLARKDLYESLRRHGLKSIDVLWLSSPVQVFAARSIRSRFLVYDCADYNEGYGESILFPKAFLRRRILGRERNLLSKADIVFAGNQDLKTRGSRYNSNVQMLVNGVGREFLGEVDEIPPEMTDLPHPIIGYVGFLSDYFDFGMIERAARARPHWSFVFVGPWSDSIGKKIEQLECLSNLHFAGKKPYDMIPAYIQSFDVTMIPFLRTEITHDMMPLKLFEYLCRGKPVVSTRILERPEQLEDMVYFTDETDFVKTIEKALNENSPIHVRARVRWATRFTWDYQIERVESVLRSHHVGASTN